MGKQSGFWKSIKNGVSKALNFVGSGMQKLSEMNIIPSIFSVLPGEKILNTIVAKPLNRVVEKVGTTLTKFGDAVDGKINSKELFNYINDEYKYSALLSPYNVYKTLDDAKKNGKKNGKTHFESITDGVKTITKDVWDYYSEMIK